MAMQYYLERYQNVRMRKLFNFSPKPLLTINNICSTGGRKMIPAIFVDLLPVEAVGIVIVIMKVVFGGII